MNKQSEKRKKIQTAEVKSTQSRLVYLTKRATLFIIIMVVSFIVTIGIVRLLPHLLIQVKRISLPNLSSLFSKKGEKKITFTGNESYTEIDPMLLKSYLDTKTKNIVILDTRSKAEYDNGHIKGALNIPLYEDFRNPYETVVNMTDWVGKVKKHSWLAREIVLYSYQPEADVLHVALDTLRKRGVRAKALSVGFNEWQTGFWNWMAGGELNGMVNINDYIERK